MADDITTKAAIAAGRRAVKRAADDLLLSDDEKAARTAEEERAAKSRRWKWIAGLILAVVLVIGVVGLVLSYWYWFLLAGVLGVAAMLGWQRLRGGSEKKAEVETTEPRAAKKTESPKEKVRVAPPENREDDARKAAEAMRAEAARLAREQAEARALQEAQVDEELARLKARVKR